MIELEKAKTNYLFFDAAVSGRIVYFFCFQTMGNTFRKRRRQHTDNVLDGGAQYFITSLEPIEKVAREILSFGVIELQQLIRVEDLDKTMSIAFLETKQVIDAFSQCLRELKEQEVIDITIRFKERGGIIYLEIMIEMEGTKGNWAFVSFYPSMSRSIRCEFIQNGGKFYPNLRKTITYGGNWN